MTASLPSPPPAQVTNLVNLSGGGSSPASSQILTTFGSAGFAQAILASPAGGSGSSQVFTFTVTDPNGWQNINLVDVIANQYLNGVNACYMAIVPGSASSGTVLLVDNAGDAGGPFAAVSVPGGGSGQNSQCSIAGGTSAISGSDNTLQVTLSLTFSSAFSGVRTIYVAAQNGLGNAGWQALATWTVPAAAAATGPGVAGMTPQRNSLTFGRTYTFTFSDTNGWQDLAVLDVMVNAALNGLHACYFAFVATGQTSGALYLVDDAGDAGGPFAPLALPGSGTVSNSQCSISGTGAYVSAIGNTLNLILPITFSEAFGGNRLVYLAARNNSGSNTGWVTGGRSQRAVAVESRALHQCFRRDAMYSTSSCSRRVFIWQNDSTLR